MGQSWKAILGELQVGTGALLALAAARRQVARTTAHKAYLDRYFTILI